jgi:hypothetical protein
VSAKRTIHKFKLLSAQSAGANFTGPVTSIEYEDNVSIQVDVLSGTPTGTLNVQVSLDYAQDNNGNVLNAGHWITILSAALSAGSPADTLFELLPTSAPWMRLQYVRTSGTGTIDAFYAGKSI